MVMVLSTSERRGQADLDGRSVVSVQLIPSVLCCLITFAFSTYADGAVQLDCTHAWARSMHYWRRCRDLLTRSFGRLTFYSIYIF